MKILIVTNLYPPHHVGGYEIGCRDVAQKLRARGHDIHVLTSSFFNAQAASTSEAKNIQRVLQFNHRAGDPAHDKRTENAKLIRAVRHFQPDIVYFWNLAGLSLWLPFAAHWHGCRMAFFLSDTNFVSWCIAAWLLGPSKSNPLVRAVFGRSFLARGWPVVENRTCHFCSDFIRQTAVKHGVAFAPINSVVAHWGIEPKDFPASPRSRWPVKKILYAGQMIPQKGVHTAIKAIARLAKEKQFAGVTLSVAGGGMHPDYENKLRAMPAELGVVGNIQFLGRVPRAELSRVYAEHDVLLFPSEWDEPFAITPLEAIASGLAVVGTTTGGSGELFRNRQTAMTFAAGDEADCARAIRELCADEKLFQTITTNARREVQKKHTLDAMVDKIEASLEAECAT